MKNLTNKGIPSSLLELKADLMAAAQNGNTEAVKMLAEWDANINGNNSLIVAIEKGHLDIVNTLLDQGANINHKYYNDWTALMYAAQNEHTETINLLLERGADINATDTNGKTALMIATIHKHTKIVKLLLERGADINATDTNGKTALMISALREPEIVTILLDRGANINAKDNNGETALMQAMIFGHKNTFRPLLERGSNLPDDKSRILSTMEQASWWTPFHTAVISDKLAKINGFHYKDSKKITPLDLAIMIGNLDAVKTIIGPNIKCDINDCLRKSIFSKRNEVARFFLENGANPSSKNKRGQTVFHISATTNNHTIIRTLNEFDRKNNAAKLIQNNFRLSIFHSKERNFLPDEIYQNIKSMRIS